MSPKVTVNRCRDQNELDHIVHRRRRRIREAVRLRRRRTGKNARGNCTARIHTLDGDVKSGGIGSCDDSQISTGSSADYHIAGIKPINRLAKRRRKVDR